jgi:hypothetical protein
MNARCGYRRKLHENQKDPALCDDPNVPLEVCFLIVVAWGGIYPRNALRAWAARAQWLPILAALRDGTLRDRGQIYTRFLDADIPGLGPAYFTKLMYFFSRGQCCYILDRWTGRSTNLLLAAAPAIHFIGNWVSRKNGADAYLAYCALVDQLAQLLGRSGDVIEENMFAGGGAHPWRRYVR